MPLASNGTASQEAFFLENKRSANEDAYVKRVMDTVRASSRLFSSRFQSLLTKWAGEDGTTMLFLFRFRSLGSSFFFLFFFGCEYVNDGVYAL